jgi:hypothetical protein
MNNKHLHLDITVHTQYLERLHVRVHLRIPASHMCTNNLPSTSINHAHPATNPPPVNPHSIPSRTPPFTGGTNVARQFPSRALPVPPTSTPQPSHAPTASVDGTLVWASGAYIQGSTTV